MGTSFSCGMARTIFLCLLMNYISAAPVCKTSLKFNQVGLCSSNGSVEIWDCAACQPGLGQSVECGQNYKQGTKVGCEPCTTGTYSDTYDISQCKKCTLCQKNEIKSGRCTSFEDSITCTCKSGYYRDTHTRACKQCSWCCGDKSNEYVPECNVLQVPPGKRCSFQTVKSCAPTTPAPTTIATSPSTNLPTTGISSSSSSAPRTIEKTTITKKDNTKKSSNSLLPTKVLNDPEITKDPPEGESWLKDWVKTLVLSVVSIAACFIACIFITLYCFHKKRKESTSPNPTCSCTASGSTSPDPYTCTCTASGQPLLEGNNRENNSNGSRPEERVHLNPSAAAAAYHVPQGPNGAEPPQANATENNSANVSQEESKCFKFKTINEALPDTLKIELQIDLDPNRPFGGDIGSLADAYGCKQRKINYLKSLKLPTQELLQEQGDSTLLDLMDKLKGIGREDVAKLIYDHIRKNCTRDCEQCVTW